MTTYGINASQAEAVKSKPNYWGKKQHRNSEYEAYDYHMECSGQILSVCKQFEYLHQSNHMSNIHNGCLPQNVASIICVAQPV